MTRAPRRGAAAQAGPGPQPPGGGRHGRAGFRAGRAAGVDPGELAQPLPLQPVDEGAQGQHPPGRGRIGQRGQVLPGQRVNRGSQPA